MTPVTGVGGSKHPTDPPETPDQETVDREPGEATVLCTHAPRPVSYGTSIQPVRHSTARTTLYPPVYLPAIRSSRRHSSPQGTSVPPRESTPSRHGSHVSFQHGGISRHREEGVQRRTATRRQSSPHSQEVCTASQQPELQRPPQVTDLRRDTDQVESIQQQKDVETGNVDVADVKQEEKREGEQGDRRKRSESEVGESYSPIATAESGNPPPPITDGQEIAPAPSSNDPSKLQSQFKQLVILLLISIMPFGGHFVKNCLSSIEVYLVEDPKLHMSELGYGLIVSMVSLPNFFIPFLGGIFLDKRGHRFATLVFLFLVLMGQVIFTVAVQLGSFEAALVGRFILGLGEGSVVVAQRAIMSSVFKAKSQMTFAMGVSVAMACVSKTLSRATVVPAANLFGSYIAGLWYTVLMCLISTLAGIIFIVLSDADEKEDPFEKRHRKSKSYRDLLMTEPPRHGQMSRTPTARSILSLPNHIRSFSTAFWLVTVLHTIYINVFHIFLNFSSHYFMRRFNKDPQEAANVTASASVLVIFLGPLVGYMLDIWGGQLVVCVLSSVPTTVAYYLLTYTHIEPLFSIILMSVGESFIPIVTMALIPFTVPDGVYGAAYGIMEVTVPPIWAPQLAIAIFAGNVLTGYLLGNSVVFAGSVPIGYLVDYNCAIVTFGGNVFIGYLIDYYHGEYQQAMFSLFLLAVLGMLVFFVLQLWDVILGQNSLNKTRQMDYEALSAMDE